MKKYRQPGYGDGSERSERRQKERKPRSPILSRRSPLSQNDRISQGGSVRIVWRLPPYIL